MQIFNINIPKLPLLLLKPFLLSLFFSVAFLLSFLSSQTHKTTPSTTKLFSINSSSLSLSSSTDDLRIRRRYPTYESYIHHQLNKTLNPKLRKIWTTRDWDRKVRVFSDFFSSLKRRRLLSNTSKSLCLAGRVGQEVASLLRVGVSDSSASTSSPRHRSWRRVTPRAAFQRRDFRLRVLECVRPRAVPVEVRGGDRTDKYSAISRWPDKYSANDLYSEGPLVELFKGSELVEVRKIDGFGLDTEVVFRKKMYH